MEVGLCWLPLSSLSEQDSAEELPAPPLPLLPLLLLLLLWVLTCFARWSLRMNRLLQTGQANLFSPVWVRRCRCNSSERVNRLPQKSQLQTNGRSPVCHRKWAFRCDVFP